MSKVRLAAVLVLSLLSTVLVVSASGSVHDADAQSSCVNPVTTEAAYDACVLAYNSGRVDMTISLGANINHTEVASLIGNISAMDATLTIEGNGYTLDASGELPSDAIVVGAGGLIIRDLTITGGAAPIRASTPDSQRMFGLSDRPLPAMPGLSGQVTL